MTTLVYEATDVKIFMKKNSPVPILKLELTNLKTGKKYVAPNIPTPFEGIGTLFKRASEYSVKPISHELFYDERVKLVINNHFKNITYVPIIKPRKLVNPTWEELCEAYLSNYFVGLVSGKYTPAKGTQILAHAEEQVYPIKITLLDMLYHWIKFSNNF